MSRHIEVELTQQEVASLLGVNRRTINRLASSGVFKKQVSGKYVLCDIVKDYFEYLREGKKVGKSNETYNEAKTRLTIAQANKSKLEEKKLKKELIRKDEVDKQLHSMAIITRTKLLNIHKQPLIPKETKETVKRLITEALEDLKKSWVNNEQRAK